jgi:hypothetical protein
MTETNTQLKNPFKEDTTKHKIFQKYFVEQNTDINSVAQDLGLAINTIKTQLYLIKKDLSRNGDTSTNNITNNLSNANQVFEVSIKIEGESLILFVRTCKEFEDWLKANKEVKETTNLWNKNRTSKFYHLKIVDNSLDDINKPIVLSGQINFAVLRIPGISEGLKFEIDGLLSHTQLTLALKKLLKAYKDFFKLKINIEKIDIKGEVLVAQ